MSSFTVTIDDRIRVMSALLAMTTWPLQEQAEHPHGVHAHARATRTFLRDYEEHPAVMTFQELMESGLSLSTITSYATHLDWPGLRARQGTLPDWAPADWAKQIRELVFASHIKEWWAAQQAAPWEAAEAEATRALATGDPRGLLSQFFGPVEEELVVQPNLCYPTEDTLSFRWGERLIAVVPPQVAWGNNPPWPYDDDPAATQRDTFRAYLRILIADLFEAHHETIDSAQAEELPVPNTFRAKIPGWRAQLEALLTAGLTAIYLDETFGVAEKKAFVMMEHKAYSFKGLDSVIEVLQRYREAHAEGKYTTFGGYIPMFAKALRLTKDLSEL